MKKIVTAIFFALIFTVAGRAAAYDIPQTVRIGINASSLAETVTVTANGGVYTNAEFMADNDVNQGAYYIGDTVTVTRNADGTLAVNGMNTGVAQIDLYKATDYITCQNKSYRGDIRLIWKSEGILIVNCIGMDDYLYGVLGREMSESFPLEALKAQAVAARNYTMISMNRHNADGFDLCNGVHCQAYGAVASEGDKIRRAVNETSGKVLLYNGKPVQCYYFSSDGGFTENSENVWTASLGYLKGKADPYEDASRIPNYYWTVTFTAQEIKDALAARGIDIGDIEDVSVTEYTPNHHATKLLIKGTLGTKEYTKDNIRAAMPSSLRSTLFTIAKSGSAEVTVMTGNGMEKRAATPAAVLSGNGKEYIGGSAVGEYVFSGSGYGHGVGMSQYGAMFMAEKGMTYMDILKFYFANTEISD